MRNFRITFLIVGCLFAFGIYGLVHIQAAKRKR